MKILGLTGSIAMGKSEVAQILRSVGIPVFDADGEVHRLYDSREGADLVRSLVPEAVTNDKVDRGILSKQVLANGALLEELEKLVHREIRKSRDAFIEAQRQIAAPLVVLDIPLLFESGSEIQCDAILVVSSDPDLQTKRALGRPGMTEQKLKMILKKQMPDAEKRRRANFIIENNGSKDELRQAVLSLLEKLDIEGGRGRNG